MPDHGFSFKKNANSENEEIVLERDSGKYDKFDAIKLMLQHSGVTFTEKVI